MTEETAAPVEEPIEDSTEPTDESSSESAEQPTEEVSAPEASTQPPAEEDEDEPKKGSLLVTPEELKRIKADPALSKLHRSLNKGFTEKTQALAAQRKEADQALQLFTALRNDPKGTLEVLNRFAGVQSGAPAGPDADVQAEMNALFGDDIGPKVAQVVQRLVDARTSGLSKTVESTVNDIKVSSSLDALRTFRESHPDLGEVIAHDADGNPVTVEARMVELTNELEFKQPVDPQTYLARLYRMAKADVDAKTQTAKLAAKIAAKTNSSAAASKSPGTTPATQVALSFPTGKGAFQRAFEMALKGQRAG